MPLRLLQLVLCGFAPALTQGLRPSAGCGGSADPGPLPPTDQPISRNINVTDAHFKHVKRRYVLHVPPGYSAAGPPAPLQMYFHMQDESPEDAEITEFVRLGNAHSAFTVYPEAHKAGGTADTQCGPAWNVGVLGNLSDTCTRQTWSMYGCNAQNDGYSCTCCHSSCRHLGLCTDAGAGAGCLWSACYSDVAFVEAILAELATEFCIDLDAQFATGASNGGMLVHTIAAQLPTAFAAVAPIYGLPLAGHQSVPAVLANVSILEIHDRWDEVIPLKGGQSNEGWLYTPLANTTAAWAAAKGCSNLAATAAVTTPIEFDSRFLACSRYAHCSDDVMVRRS